MTKDDKRSLKALAVKDITAFTGDREGAALAVNVAVFMDGMSRERRTDFQRWLRSLVKAYDSVILQPERWKHKNMST